jgi:hypothetical protein
MSDNLPLNWSDKINSPELEAFIKQYGDKYYMTAEQINQLRDAVNKWLSSSNLLSRLVLPNLPLLLPEPVERGAVEARTYANHSIVLTGANK